MFLNELDILEIRLNILDPFVDCFVLGESYQTFSGKKKPLYYQDNRKRFKKWNHKIRSVIIPDIDVESAFNRAGYQKDYLKTQLVNCKDDDVIYFGDVDEIWRPQEVDDKVYNLRQLNYSYYLNNRSSEEWVGTIVSKYKNIKKNSFNDFRATHTNILDDGGYHFSNQGGIKQIQKKLEAYDHTEYDTPEIKEKLEERMKNGEDYVGRAVDWQGKPFTFWIDESQLPQYLIDNKEKYVAYFK